MIRTFKGRFQMKEEAMARCIGEAGAAEVKTMGVQAFTPSPFERREMAGSTL